MQLRLPATFYGLTTLSCLVLLGWIFFAYELVPREWNSSMRLADRDGRFESNEFVKGGYAGGDFRVSPYGTRNLVEQGLGTDASPFTKPLDLGPRSSRNMAVVAGGRVLISGDLGSAPLEDLEFIVFSDERIYRYQWRNVNGAYWRRR